MGEKYPLQVLYVDDDEQMLDQIRTLLADETVSCNDQEFLLHVTTSPNFEGALDLLQTHRFDLLILDVRFGSYFGDREEEAGERTYQQIKQACFIPVVFYTGLPGRVSHLKSPFVYIVEKTESSAGLLNAFTSILTTRVPEINRALVALFEHVKRDYFWKFVENHWQDFDTSQYPDLAYLLARRVAASLSDVSIKRLFENAKLEGTNDENVHPLRYYIMPAVAPFPLVGDLYKGIMDDKELYFVILTPSCDLYEGGGRMHKAEHVLLAECKPLSEMSEYINWKSSPAPSNTVKNKLKDILLRNERFYYLPEALILPNLVIDFQKLKAVSYNDVHIDHGRLKRIASLDSPYAEAVLTKFARYFGRVGTPDLDIAAVFPQLT